MICRSLSYKENRSQKAQKFTKGTKGEPLFESVFLCAFCDFCAFCGLFYEPVADRIVSEFSVGSHFHLVENATAIGADRFIAE